MMKIFKPTEKLRKAEILDKEIIDLLKDAQRVSHAQYTSAKQFLLTISKTKDNVQDSFTANLLLPLCISQPSLLISNLTPITNKIHGKTGAKLFQLRDDIRYQYSSLQEYVQYYKSQVKLNEGSYYENITELSKMHDELGRYMSNKNFDKSNGSEWYEGYFSIFGTWFRNGADKNTDATYNEIVLKIVALNQLYRFVPFVIQTTTCCLNCITAYNNIVVLNNLLEEKILQYAYYYKLSYKIVRLILQKNSSLPVKQDTNVTLSPAPVYSETTPQRLAENTSETEAGNTNSVTSRRPLYIRSAAILVAILAISYFLYPTFWHRQAGVKTRPDLSISHADSLVNNSYANVRSATIDSLTNTDTLSAIADFKILFNADNSAASSVYGIDVSRYQGTLIKDVESFDTLHFVICKATEGGKEIDRDFGLNWSLIKQKGLIRGAYHFFHSEDSPVEQAQLFLQTIKELHNTDIPPIVDVEEASIRNNVTPYQLDSSLLIFLRYIQEKTNRKPIIYSDVSFANRFLVADSLAQYALWLAEYSRKSVPEIPRLWKDKGYIIWQRSASYNIDAHVSDFDIFNGNGKAFARFIRSN